MYMLLTTYYFSKYNDAFEWPLIDKNAIAWMHKEKCILQNLLEASLFLFPLLYIAAAIPKELNTKTKVTLTVYLSEIFCLWLSPFALCL